MKILSLLPRGFEGSILWRTIFPSRALQKHGHVADYVYFEDYNSIVLPLLTSGKYDTIITPRFIFREAWMMKAFERTVRQHHLTWLYDLDDDTLTDYIVDRNVQYWLANDQHPEMSLDEKLKYLKAGHEYECYMRQQLIQRVDGVIVSRKPLVEVVKQYTDAPVRVLENAMDFDWFEDRMCPPDPHPLTIGWSGSWRNDDDLKTLSQAWTNISKIYPDVEFMIDGYVSPSLVLSVPHQKLKIMNWVDIDKYPAQLQHFDIGCCSVADIPWNLCKSPIKWFEMTLAGTPCVVSKALYGEYVTHQQDGFTATQVQDYTFALEQLIMNEDLRRSTAYQALQTVDKYYNIDKQWMDWVSTINEFAEIACD